MRSNLCTLIIANAGLAQSAPLAQALDPAGAQALCRTHRS
jgi:hypothetical protein